MIIGEITPRSVLRFRPVGDTSYTAPVTKRRTHQAQRPAATAPTTGGQPPATKSKRQLHWFTIIMSLSMVATLVLIWVCQMMLNSSLRLLDDLVYGYPRTTRVMAFVQHERSNAPSGFLAVNEQGSVTITELPGGDASMIRVYQGPRLIGEGVDLLPVTLQFVDLNGDKVPDLLIQIGSVRQWYRNAPGQSRFIAPQ